MTIDISCPGCGSNRIAFSHAVSDACDVSCEECGRVVGSFGELKAAVARQLSGAIRRSAIPVVKPPR